MRGKKARIGLLLFLASLAVFGVYTIFIYIPAIQADINDVEAINRALIFALGCGLVGTIGLVIDKNT